MNNRTVLDTFDIDTLPDLDVAVLGALELFSDVDVPKFDLADLRRPLVLGSGNAYPTGRALFDANDAVFADESTFENVLRSTDATDAVVLSASGGKHAVSIAQALSQRNTQTRLFTNNPQAAAREYIDDACVYVYPKNREPYSYNTSTYLGMLLSKTKEDPAALLSFIDKEVRPHIPDTLAEYNAYYFIIPPHCSVIASMFVKKINEFFGGRIAMRAFTVEQSKHGETIVPSESELFVSFGEENTVFGSADRRLHIPLSAEIDCAGMMAIGYYLIGHIQKQHPPYFKEHIQKYANAASELFGERISPIVE